MRSVVPFFSSSLEMPAASRASLALQPARAKERQTSIASVRRIGVLPPNKIRKRFYTISETVAGLLVELAPHPAGQIGELLEDALELGAVFVSHYLDLLLELGDLCLLSAPGHGWRSGLIHDSDHRLRPDFFDIIDRVEWNRRAARKRRSLTADEELIEGNLFRLFVARVEGIGAGFREGHGVSRGLRP